MHMYFPNSVVNLLYCPHKREDHCFRLSKYIRMSVFHGVFRYTKPRYIYVCVQFVYGGAYSKIRKQPLLHSKLNINHMFLIYS